MTSASSALNQLAEGLRIELDGPGYALPGQIVKFRIVPQASALTAPHFLEEVTRITGAIQVPVQLDIVSWTVKTAAGGKEEHYTSFPTQLEGDKARGAREIALTFKKELFGSATGAIQERFIQATVKLVAGATISNPIALPPVRIQLVPPELLRLEIVRDGVGQVIPGQRVPLQVLSPVVPLPWDSSGASALPATGLAAALASLPVQVDWSVTRKVALTKKDAPLDAVEPLVALPFESPEGLSFPKTSLVFPWVERKTAEPLQYDIGAKVRFGLGSAEAIPSLDLDTITLDVMSIEDLKLLRLKIVRDGVGQVIPGQRVPLQVLSPVVPLPWDSSGASAPPATGLAAALASLPMLIDWSVEPTSLKASPDAVAAPAVPSYVSPEGLTFPKTSLVFSWLEKPEGRPLQYDVMAKVLFGLGTAETVPSLDLEKLTLDVMSIEELGLSIDGMPLNNEGKPSLLLVPGQDLKLKLLSTKFPVAEPGGVPSPAAGHVEVVWSVSKNVKGTMTLLKKGIDYDAPDGLLSPLASFIFPWDKAPDPSNAGPNEYSIQATARVVIGGQGMEIPLPAIPVKVVSLEMLQVPIERSLLGESQLFPGQRLTLIARPTLPPLPLPVKSSSPAGLAAVPPLGPGPLPDLLPLQVTVRATVDELPELPEIPSNKVVCDTIASGLSMLFPVRLTELRADASTLIPDMRKVALEVDVSVGNKTATIPIPEKISVPVLPLPIPTLAAFFRHADFRVSVEGAGDGAVLIAVPDFTIPPQELGKKGHDLITGLLNPVSAALASLKVIDGLGYGQLASQIGQFVDSITAHAENVQILRVPKHPQVDRYEVGDLSGVDLIPARFPKLAENANNEFSSLIFFCAYWRKLVCSNDHTQQADKGEFVLGRSNWYYSGVRNLHVETPVAFPENEPDLLWVLKDYPSTEKDGLGRTGFGDTITSFMITHANAES